MSIHRPRMFWGLLLSRPTWRLGLLAGAVLPASPASAQMLFDTMFGPQAGPPPSATAYANPAPGWSPFGPRNLEPVPPDPVPTVAYCVRLCDGRYFPIEPHASFTPAQACGSFCPASQTRIYHGVGIEAAVAADGKNYRQLGTAFVYREKIIPGCSCNGKDAFGLVNIQISDDRTLRPGDIVATATGGLMAYNGMRGRAASFTPIRRYAGLSAQLRRRLAETKVEQMPLPALDAPAAKSPDPPKPRTAGNRRAHNER